LRTGVGLPWGDAELGDALSGRSGTSFPIAIDAGFKLSKPLFLGVYLGYGYGSGSADACADEGFDCSTSAWQFGIQGQYHFGASELINPWVGYGVGYEILRQNLSAGSYSETQTSSGLTYLKASIGADYRSSVGLGPFFEVSAGRFEGSTTEVDDLEVHEGPVDSAWHGLFTIGFRVVVLP
jgi:hypothetical protein